MQPMQFSGEGRRSEILGACNEMASQRQIRGFAGVSQHAHLQPSPQFSRDAYDSINDTDTDNDDHATNKDRINDHGNNATLNFDHANSTDSATIDVSYAPIYSPRLSRSPHPYHRISSKLANWERDDFSITTTMDDRHASDSGSINDCSNVSQRKRQRINYRIDSGNGHRWSRTSPRASSESGTEADDESTGLLKGLPAPPARPSRKGLRSTSGRDDPLLWLQHETPRSWSLFVRSPARQPKRSSSDESMRDSDTYSTVRGVIARRKRNEILRRGTETALLVSVGLIVLLQEDARSCAFQWHKGIPHFILLDAPHR